MTVCSQGEILWLSIEGLGECYRRYRLRDAAAESAMVGSLARDGQISPIVVCQREETPEVLDGFKRLSAARALPGVTSLEARILDVDEPTAKVTILGLNGTGRRMKELEEAWIVHALVREDGLSQVEVAELLGRHKSWVCRRLALSFVRELLARWPEITSMRVHEELRGRGFSGGYTIVKDLVRRLRPPRSREPVVRFETGPGVQAQMDYAVYNIDFSEEGRRRVNLFSYVLGHSRRQYLRFVPSQDFETTIREHVRAFEHLQGVAATCLYDTAEVVYRAVNAESMVAYRQNSYSVPWQCMGQVLPLRITEDELIVYGPDLAVLARHPLLPRTATGQRSHLPEHRPQEDQLQKERLLRERFAELGPAASRFFEGLLTTHRMGKNQAQRVLALLETYRREDLVGALQRAVRFGAFSLRAVERILAAQAQPKTPLEALGDQQQRHLREILQDPSVPPRPTADYEQLDSTEAPDDDQPPESEDEPKS